MIIYYVDWWHEDFGHLRRHFRTRGDAQKHYGRVRRASSGNTILYKVELKQTKDAIIVALNTLSLGLPIDPYLNSTKVVSSKPTPAMMRKYEEEP